MNLDDKAKWIAGKYSHMTSEKMEVWYNRKLQLNFFRKSSEKSYPAEGEPLQFNKKGFLTNAEFNGLGKYGVPLSERKFIDRELQEIESFDWKSIIEEEQTILETYRKFLLKKMQKIDSQKINTKAASSKYYAYLHLLLIETGQEPRFERNDDDLLPKNEIKNLVAEKYPNVSKEGFYKNFQKFSGMTNRRIAQELGQGFKKTIQRISGNNKEIVNILGKKHGK